MVNHSTLAKFVAQKGDKNELCQSVSKYKNIKYYKNMYRGFNLEIDRCVLPLSDFISYKMRDKNQFLKLLDYNYL